MTNTLTMDTLYDKLTKFGITKRYVNKNGLPSWWDKELNDKPFAVLECSGYIANRFGLDLKSLLSKDDTLRFSGLTQTKFKERTHNKKSEIAHGLAHRFAQIIAEGCDNNFFGIPDNVDEIRQEILQTHSTIDLESLLDYCWVKGIAVAHFNYFSKGKTKFEGMIQLCDKKKPIVILAINNKQPSARFTFALAHELAHLALGHITEGQLVESEIDFDNKSRDNEEREANEFAVQLLLDDYDNVLGDKKFKNVDKLLEKVALIVDDEPKLDKSRLILNYGWHNKSYLPMAIKALGELEKKSGTKLLAAQYINEYLADKLNWDYFDDDIYEYLEQMLGV